MTTKYHLVIITNTGEQVEIIANSRYKTSISAGQALAVKNPELQIAVTNEQGNYLWPKDMKKLKKIKGI